MARSIDKTRAAMQTASAVMPSPPIRLNQRETELYAQTMASIAPPVRSSAIARSLAASIAQCMAEIETASELIERHGLILESPQGIKANPAAGIRDAAAKRLAALASRLKALPSGDSREMQRAVQFEQAHRGGSPVVSGGAGQGEVIDWKEALRRERGDA